MTNEINEKLVQLRQKYLEPEDTKVIDAVEKALRTKITASKLAQRDEVKLIIEDGKKRINDINFMLAYDRELTSEQREGLFKERIAHQFYLDRFGVKNVEGFIKALDEWADEKLSS